jgi:lysyl-tRNA synthetase class 2
MNNGKESSDLVGQRNLRIEKLNKLKELEINPFPAKSNKQYPNSEIVNNFVKYNGKEVVLAGRVVSWREHGKLKFGDLVDESGKIQLYVREDAYSGETEGFLNFTQLSLLDVGDIIEVIGEITKTQRGEISILVKSLRILTKSVRPLPTELEDKEDRFRRRYLDMLLHPEIRERFKRRSMFWQATRDFLNNHEFVEINIPVLEHTTGGADAKPFVTHYDALDQDFFLRISHELPLKRLLGAGFEKVYDIGARFRNEGFSDEHLPEHVAMEFYWAYADYRDGMKFTQELFKYVLSEVYGTLQFNIRGFEVNLEGDWPEVRYEDIIKDKFGVDIFADSVEEMNEVLKKNGVDLGENINKNRVVDNLWKLIRKTIAGPVFLVDVPKFLSPLAKSNPKDERFTLRFFPIIAGSELANAFSELNDPLDQLERFVEQQKLREAGDDEAQMLDIDFVEMLEYGMPPAVGFGMSERVFWFFEGITAKEGVPFPQLKQEFDNTTKKIYGDVMKYAETEMYTAKNKIEKSKDLFTNLKEKDQDFNKKIVIVVNQELPSWQIGNAIGHISAYLGNKLEEDFASGFKFITKDDFTHPNNSQYPIVILAAKLGQMQNLMAAVRDSGLAYHGFIREMVETSDDEKIESILKEKKDADMEYLGIGIFGEKAKVDALTKKFSLWK